MCAIALSRPGIFFASSSSCCHWSEPVSLSIATNVATLARTMLAPAGIELPPALVLDLPPPHPATSPVTRARNTTRGRGGVCVIITESVVAPRDFQLTRWDPARQARCKSVHRRAEDWRFAVQPPLYLLPRLADYGTDDRPRLRKVREAAVDIGAPDTEREIEIAPLEEPFPAPGEEPAEEPVPAGAKSTPSRSWAGGSARQGA